jgi:hypothetical protein
MPNIKLHKKHGLNPTLEICFVCGEDKGSITLLGNAYKDQAPTHMILNKEPCDKCKSYIENDGVILISVKDDENGENPYRTGSFWVIKKEAAEKLGIKNPISFIEDSVVKEIGLI